MAEITQDAHGKLVEYREQLRSEAGNYTEAGRSYLAQAKRSGDAAAVLDAFLGDATIAPA